jgi:sigma-B regulation protein RsbU (phosphoserine phosphatase)
MDKSLIRHVPLFSSLPPGEIDLLAAELKESVYPAQTVLFHEGEFGDRFFIVAAGEVSIIKAMDTPNERQVALRGVGQFIGEMSLLNPDGLRTASARVRSEARLLELSRDDFNALLKREPSLAYEMLSVLSRRLREAHNSTIIDLTEKNRQLTQAYDELKAAQEQIIEKKTLERELEQAREIQMSMLPTLLPKLDGFDIGTRMLPARMVGGDFYDVIRLSRDSLGIVIGDVAGKGVPAALFMALTRSLLRAEARPGAAPESALQRVNHHLLGMNAKGLFVTVLYGILQRETGEFVYARAGHEPPILWDDQGKVLPVELGNGQVLGLLLKPIIEPRSVTIPPGGGMLLVSDGVAEASNERDELFGSDRLDASIPTLQNLPTQAKLDRLLHILDDFRGRAHQADDITMIAVQAN